MWLNNVIDGISIRLKKKGKKIKSAKWGSKWGKEKTECTLESNWVVTIVALIRNNQVHRQEFPFESIRCRMRLTNNLRGEKDSS